MLQYIEVNDGNCIQWQVVLLHSKMMEKDLLLVASLTMGCVMLMIKVC